MLFLGFVGRDDLGTKDYTRLFYTKRIFVFDKKRRAPLVQF
jgi:hypothetical protein